MADQNLTGVTTRELTTGQDSARASAISQRSQLATSYTDQFRGDRNSMRRGGVTRDTTGPSVPEAQGDVTQSQDTSVPPSFQDVIMSGNMDGDSQNANQVVNPGPDGGGSGGGGSSIGSGSSGGGSSSGGSSSSGGQSGDWTWTDNNGDTVDAPTDTTMNYGDEAPAEYDRMANDNLPEGYSLTVTESKRHKGGFHTVRNSRGRVVGTWGENEDGSMNPYKSYLWISPTSWYNKVKAGRAQA